MAGAKNHDYHILPPDIWPLVGAFTALTMTSGLALFMHDMAFGKPLLIAGLIGVLFTMFSWWTNVVKEAKEGFHTPVVQLHLRYGMILFIASEVMFFVGWFWSYFDFALFPAPLEIVDGARRACSASRVKPPRALSRSRAWKCSTPSTCRCSTR
jgi:cytochrome c oxidase subunit 3